MANLKKVQDRVMKDVSNLGITKTDYSAYIEAFKKFSNVEKFRKLLAKAFDKKYAGKTLGEVKTAELKSIKSLGKATFEHFWDSNKKTFVNCEEGVGKMFKKAARTIQGKYAAIYGAIGAGVLGLGALLCCGGKKAPEQLPME